MGSVIGEVLSIIEVSSKVWTSFSNAKGRVHDAFDVISKSQAQFELYKPQVEKYLDKRNLPKNYALFTQMMQDFGVKVQRLIELMQKYKGGLIGDKAWFMVKYLSELDDIVKTLEAHRNSFIGFVQDMDQFNKNTGAQQKAEADAQKEIDKAKAKEWPSDSGKSKQQEDELKRLREQNLIYKVMLEKREELVAAAKDETGSEWEKIERSLINYDDRVSREDARRILAPLKGEIKKIVQDETPLPILAKEKKLKHVFRIVCVDFSNGARSTFAQCYLERIRLWTANTTGHWLFNRIESAGAGLESSFFSEAFAKGGFKGFKGLEDAVAKLGGSPLDPAALAVFEASLGARTSREERALLERMKLVKRQDINKQTLLGARHILCFGNYTAKSLSWLRDHALSTADEKSLADMKHGKNGEITFLPSRYLSDNASTAELEAALANVKTQIDRFLVNRLNWMPPTAPLWNGLYRSRQFLIPQAKRDVVNARLKEIERKNDCKYIKVYTAAPQMGVLITIVGSMDWQKLLQAENDIKSLL